MRKKLKQLKELNPTASDLIVELLFAFLALASTISFGLDPYGQAGSDIHAVMEILDPWICVLFASRFFWELHRAPVKRQFLKWGWIDLVAAIPTTELVRGLRVIRLVLLVRLLRSTTLAVHGHSLLAQWTRTQTLITMAFAVVITSMVGSSFVLLGFEKQAGNANITTPGDALWWSLVTITTVGYGDHYPVTTAGRLVAAWLMVVGLGVTGTVAGVVASWIYGGKTGHED